MRLLIVRHGLAEERAAWAARGGSEADRPLTAEGRRRLRAAARGLADELPDLTLVATSPLARAAESARLLAAAWPRANLVELPALAPGGDAEAVLDWLATQRRKRSLALVGHEPDLSLLASSLLGATAGAALRLKKGGAALLDLGGRVTVGRAELLWLLTGGQACRLAR